MLQVLINLLTLNALNTPPEVYAGLVAAWLLLVVAGIASVISQPFSRIGKIAWIILVLALPVMGMVIYCVRCLLGADYAFLKMFGLHRQTSAHLRSAMHRPKS
jgi:hypothetical protein